MAITINVGGSKKVSQNYDSQGVSLNVTAEVPNDALGEPEKIAGTAQDLFDLVHELLDEQIAKLTQTEAASDKTRSGRYSSNGNGRGNSRSYNRSNGNGSTNGRGKNPNRPLTNAQMRAIENMVGRLNEDGDRWVEHEYGVSRVADLTVKQASDFIDVLKRAIEDQEAAKN